jgi:hypothetical protein
MSKKELLLNYLKTFLEVPHPSFQNLPVCPFAKKERIEDRISFLEYHFTSEEPSVLLCNNINQFLENKDVSTMLAFDPNFQISPREAHEISKKINQIFSEMDCIAIPMHPDEDFSVADVNTRKFPCFVMLIQAESDLLTARAQLALSNYYQNFSHGTTNTIAYICKQKGAFFPNLWWLPEVIVSIQSGNKLPAPIMNETVKYLTPNEIHTWMFRWGKQHHWHSFCPIKPTFYEKLCSASANGEVIVLTFFSPSSDGDVVLLTDQRTTSKYPCHIPENDAIWQKRYLSSYAWIFRPE